MNEIENSIAGRGPDGGRIDNALNRTLLPWEKLTDTERIERMRDVVKSLQREIRLIRVETNRTSDIARNHIHSSDGRVMVEPGYDNVGGSLCDPKAEAGWF